MRFAEVITCWENRSVVSHKIGVSYQLGLFILAGFSCATGMMQGTR